MLARRRPWLETPNKLVLGNNSGRAASCQGRARVEVWGNNLRSEPGPGRLRFPKPLQGDLVRQEARDFRRGPAGVAFSRNRPKNRASRAHPPGVSLEDDVRATSNHRQPRPFSTVQSPLSGSLLPSFLGAPAQGANGPPGPTAVFRGDRRLDCRLGRRSLLLFLGNKHHQRPPTAW